MRRRTVVLFVAICFAQVLLISAQVQSRSGVPLLRGLTFGAYAHVQEGIASIATGGGSLWRHYVGLRHAAQENDALRLKVLELEGQLQQDQAALSRTQALEDALKLARSLTAPTLAAHVIAGDPSPSSLTVTIDRGTADGIAPDMAVISAAGVVGRVLEHPAAHAAQVQLLTGRTAAAAATFERTGAGGVVVGGAGDPPLRMQWVSNVADVRQGDRVFTSGQDGIFPRGFLVGTVERAEKGSGVYRTVSIRPAVDFSHVDVVLVILSRSRPGGGA